MAANGSLDLCWATVLKLELIYDQRWKQRKLVWEECSYFVSRDSLFHFLPVKVSWSSADLRCFNISPAAVTQIIRSRRFLFLSLHRRLGSSNKIIKTLQCVLPESRRGQVSSPLTCWCLFQEENGGHDEFWTLLSADWTADAPLQPVHHDHIQRALWGRWPTNTHTQQTYRAEKINLYLSSILCHLFIYFTHASFRL